MKLETKLPEDEKKPLADRHHKLTKTTLILKDTLLDSNQTEQPQVTALLRKDQTAHHLPHLTFPTAHLQTQHHEVEVLGSALPELARPSCS